MLPQKAAYICEIPRTENLKILLFLMRSLKY